MAFGIARENHEDYSRKEMEQVRRAKFRKFNVIEVYMNGLILVNQKGVFVLYGHFSTISSLN